MQLFTTAQTDVVAFGTLQPNSQYGMDVRGENAHAARSRADAWLDSEMRRTRLLAFAHITCSTLVVLVLMPALSSAQDVTEAALKAAFIYNFAQFTEWPSDVVVAADPFVMCVFGDAAVGDALERAVKRRTIANHSMIVSQTRPGRSGPVISCMCQG
jgi:YfiR/HmsC-like